MKLVQKENKLWPDNGQFVPCPSSLTQLSERFHKNECLVLLNNARYFLSSSLNVTMSCIGNSVPAPQRGITEKGAASEAKC